MSLHRRAARRDANEGQIVEALERIGVTCYRISAKGLPDLLTEYRGRWLPVEVKVSKGKLTKAQREMRDETPYPVVRSVEEALHLFGVK